MIGVLFRMGRRRYESARERSAIVANVCASLTDLSWNDGLRRTESIKRGNTYLEMNHAFNPIPKLPILFDRFLGSRYFISS
jgi:hypothetical protein